MKNWIRKKYEILCPKLGVGQKTNKAKQSEEEEDCSRCGGTGIIKAFIHIEKGACFKCRR